MEKTPHLTAKQLEIIRVVTAGNPENGTDCDLDQILERVRYSTSKESLQFSIRILVERGMIEKKGTETRRGAQRRVIGVTKTGRAIGSGSTQSGQVRDQGNIVILGESVFSGGLEEVPDFIVPDFL